MSVILIAHSEAAARHFANEHRMLRQDWHFLNVAANVNAFSPEAVFLFVPGWEERTDAKQVEMFIGCHDHKYKQEQRHVS